MSQPIELGLTNKASVVPGRRRAGPSGRVRCGWYGGLSLQRPFQRLRRRRALCVGTSVADYDEEAIGMNDRYRGITGRRDVVFVNERDLASRGLQHGDLVDVSVVPDRNRTSVLCAI
jgi:hypothetical protein